MHSQNVVVPRPQQLNRLIMDSNVKLAAGDGGVSLQNFRNVPHPTATPLRQKTAGTHFICGSDERHRSVPSGGEFMNKSDTDLP